MVVTAGFAQLSQAMVSGNRILRFLNAEELCEYRELTEGADGTVIELSNVAFSWNKESNEVSHCVSCCVSCCVLVYFLLCCVALRSVHFVLG